MKFTSVYFFVGCVHDLHTFNRKLVSVPKRPSVGCGRQCLIIIISLFDDIIKGFAL